MPLAVTTETLPDATIQIQWAGGYVQIKAMALGVIFFRKVGRFPDAVFQDIIVHFEREVARCTHLSMICDCADLDDYESAYRLHWTDWFKKSRGRVRAHIYARSKLVRMALNVVNLTVPVFQAHESLEALNGVLRDLVPSFSPRMLPRPLDRSRVLA
jgi:hypothetical protein